MELKLEQVIIRDEELVVFFPQDAITYGEIIISPLHAFKTLEDVPDLLLEKMFHVLNKMSSSLFDLIGCHGTNILIQNGADAGQKSDALFIRIIPRFENDSLKLEWEPKPANPQDIESVHSAIKDLDEDIEKEKIIEKQKELAKENIEPESVKNDYLLKSIRRNP